MASDSLEHEARTRQSHSKKLGILRNKTLNSGADAGIPQSKTFSLTFSASQWSLYSLALVMLLTRIEMCDE